MGRMTSYFLLSNTGIKVLLYIQEKDSTYLTDIKRKTHITFPTAIKFVRMFEKGQLIKREKSRAHKCADILRITPKGSAVADNLRALKKTLEEK